MTTFGLTERDIVTLRTILSRYTSLEKVKVFGSRAKGTQKKGSDIDIALTDTNLSLSQIANIRNDLEESALPYSVDIIDLPNLGDSAVREHIERIGKSLF